jgi:precorrin-6B methylase 1
MATADDLEGRKPAKIPKTLVERDRTKRLIIVLENSSLESAKVTAYPHVLECAAIFGISVLVWYSCMRPSTDEEVPNNN